MRAVSMLLVLGSLSAQGRVFIVDQAGGPGAHFTELPAAVASVRDGDVLRLRPGGYTAPPPFNKAIAILGEGTAGIGGGTGAPALVIDGLPAGKEFAIKNVELYGSGSAPVEIRNCAGRVLLGHVKVRGSGSTSVQRPAMRIVNSGLVAIENSLLWFGPFDIESGSRVHFVASHCEGFPGGNGSGFSVYVSGDAFRLTASTLLIARSTVRGGTFFGPFLPAAPGRALVCNDSAVEIRGESTDVVAAGGGPPMFPVPAIDVLGTSTLLRDPAITITGANGAPAIRGSFTTNVTRRTPALRVVAAPLVRTVNTDLYSPQGDLVVFAAGLPADPVRVPGLAGSVYFDLLGPTIALGLGTQGASEHKTFGFAIPQDASLVGAKLTVQDLSGTAASGFEWSNPSSVVID